MNPAPTASAVVLTLGAAKLVQESAPEQVDGELAPHTLEAGGDTIGLPDDAPSSRHEQRARPLSIATSMNATAIDR